MALARDLEREDVWLQQQIATRSPDGCQTHRQEAGGEARDEDGPRCERRETAHARARSVANPRQAVGGIREEWHTGGASAAGTEWCCVGGGGRSVAPESAGGGADLPTPAEHQHLAPRGVECGGMREQGAR